MAATTMRSRPITRPSSDWSKPTIELKRLPAQTLAPATTCTTFSPRRPGPCDSSSAAVITGFVSAIKSAFVPGGIRPRKIAFGLYRGLIFDVDFRVEAQLYLGLWERETYQSIRRAIGRCAWAIDVGAGNGELCVHLLRSPANGPFFAFEPQSAKVAMLRRNATLNQCDNDPRLVVVEKLAGPVTTDDSIAIDDLPLDPLKRGFLKVDVDGAEMAVLEGAKTVLD